jgi:hypothetical protein
MRNLFLLAILAALAGCGNADATSAAPASTAVALHPGALGARIHAGVLGANSAVTFDTSLPGQSAAYRNAGMKAGRWPGGSAADEYDWQTTTGCRAKYYVWKSATFDRYMQSIARPAGLDVEVTVNYGSSHQPACVSPGDPKLAAAWVHYANVVQHDAIRWWEIGNEVYGSWETDKHALAHDAATYATAVGEYARLMKAQDRAIQIGVSVSPGALDPAGKNWDEYVLAHAPFDYVDLHYYAQQPGKENDAYLTATAPHAFAAILAKVKAELVAAGKPDAPIEVGEIGSVYDKPGKQTASITQGLFAGQAIGEMLAAGVQRAEWWVGNGGCGMNGNMSDALYGWQDFGGYAIFSDDLPTPAYGGCAAATETIALGTLLPTARIYQVISRAGFASEGEHMIGISVPAGLATVRAYAATHGSGYDLLLFNLDPDNAVTVPVTIDGAPGLAGYTSLTYGKAQYDRSREGTWAGPVAGKRRPWTSPAMLTLPPYSMTAYTISR